MSCVQIVGSGPGFPHGIIDPIEVTQSLHQHLGIVWYSVVAEREFMHMFDCNLYPVWGVSMFYSSMGVCSGFPFGAVFPWAYSLLMESSEFHWHLASLGTINHRG